jgi:hypothetical protein
VVLELLIITPPPIVASPSFPPSCPDPYPYTLNNTIPIITCVLWTKLSSTWEGGARASDHHAATHRGIPIVSTLLTRRLQPGALPHSSRVRQHKFCGSYVWRRDVGLECAATDRQACSQGRSLGRKFGTGLPQRWKLWNSSFPKLLLLFAKTINTTDRATPGEQVALIISPEIIVILEIKSVEDVPVFMLEHKWFPHFFFATLTCRAVFFLVAAKIKK